MVDDEYADALVLWRSRGPVRSAIQCQRQKCAEVMVAHSGHFKVVTLVDGADIAWSRGRCLAFGSV